MPACASSRVLSFDLRCSSSSFPLQRKIPDLPFPPPIRYNVIPPLPPPEAPPMKRFTIEVFTEGNTDVQNLSPQVTQQLRACGGDGILHLFVVGSTAALTTLE